MIRQKHREHVLHSDFHRVCAGVNSVRASEWDVSFIMAARSWRGPRGQYNRNRARLKVKKLEVHNAQTLQ